MIIVSLNYRPAFNSLLTLLSFHGNGTCVGRACKLVAMNGSSKTQNIINDSSSSISQIFKKNENPNISILTVLLVIIVASVTYSLFPAILKLYNRNNIVLIYFFAQDKIIPTLKHPASTAVDTQSLDATSRLVGTQPLDAPTRDKALEDLEKIKTDLLTYISSKDWGMAEFFCSMLEESVLVLVGSKESSFGYTGLREIRL